MLDQEMPRMGEQKPRLSPEIDSYFGELMKMNANQSQAPAAQIPSEGGAEEQLAKLGMSSGDPYGIAAGTILAINAAKKKEFADRQNAAMQLQQRYEQSQNNALTNLGSVWARALGR